MKERDYYRELAKTTAAASSIERIKSYTITGGEGVQLTDSELELKERIDFSDAQIRNKARLGFTSEVIANIIRMRFTVSRDTAFRYMRWAKEIYSSANPINKLSGIQARIEFLEAQSAMAAGAGDMMTVALLEPSIAKYYKELPDTKSERGSRKQIFILPVEAVKSELTVDVAVDVVSSYLKNQIDNGEE